MLFHPDFLDLLRGRKPYKQGFLEGLILRSRRMRVGNKPLQNVTTDTVEKTVTDKQNGRRRDISNMSVFVTSRFSKLLQKLVSKRWEGIARDLQLCFGTLIVLCLLPLLPCTGDPYTIVTSP